MPRKHLQFSTEAIQAGRQHCAIVVGCKYSNPLLDEATGAAHNYCNNYKAMT